MNIELKYQDRFMVAKLKGELDHHSAEKVKETLKNEIEKEIAIDIIWDFSSLRFMDSSGIGVVLGRYKEIQKKGGKMALTGLNQTIAKIVNLSGLHKILYIYPDVDSAIVSLKEEK